MSRVKLAPAELTKDELRILHAYRALDPKVKGSAAKVLEAWAPAPSKSAPEPAPAGIRLVTTAGKRVST